MRNTRLRDFAFPHEVVENLAFSLSEKRAILSEWASDACAVESFPTLRLLPGTSFPVTFSAIMDARQQLDRLAAQRETGRGRNSVVLADFAARRRSPPDPRR